MSRAVLAEVMYAVASLCISLSIIGFVTAWREKVWSGYFPHLFFAMLCISILLAYTIHMEFA